MEEKIIVSDIKSAIENDRSQNHQLSGFEIFHYLLKPWQGVFYGLIFHAKGQSEMAGSAKATAGNRQD
jgi:hypothetical protein